MLYLGPLLLCCEVLAHIRTPLRECLFYYLSPDNPPALLPVVGWNRAAFAGAALPRKQLIYHLTFFYTVFLTFLTSSCASAMELECLVLLYYSKKLLWLMVSLLTAGQVGLDEL